MSNWSENNSECQFNESAVMLPINLNTNNNPYDITNQKKNRKLFTGQNNLGQYEKYRLTRYLEGKEQSENGLLETNKNNKVIEIVTIDQSSLVVTESSEFKNLMKRYTEHEICLVAVSGDRESGKSFLCDKIYNLAEVKGNNFCRKRNAGLYTFSTPFIKDDLCIFFIEIAGCELNSTAFRILSTICLTLCSSFVFLHENRQIKEESILKDFHKTIKKSLKAFDFSTKAISSKSIQSSTETEEDLIQFHQIFPTVLYNVSRKQNYESGSINSVFKEQRNLYLANAMTPLYKGNKEDLTFCSFLTKQCVNPEYIKGAYELFNLIYKDSNEKKCFDIVIKGSIAIKLINAVVLQLNAKKKIKIHRIYTEILKDLYISAYNYCIMEYHEELEAYFQDERPKDVDEIYDVFENASNNAFQSFEDFNLQAEMHEQFEKKLQNYIDSKEKLLLCINKAKSTEALSIFFEKLDFSSTKQSEKNFRILKQSKPKLTDGRSEVIGSKLLEMLESNSQILEQNSLEIKIMQQIAQRKTQIQQKKQNLKEMKKCRSDRMKEQERTFKQKQLYAGKISGIKNKKDKLMIQKQKLLKRRDSMKNGTQKQNLENEILAAEEKLKKKKELLEKQKNVDNSDEIKKNMESNRIKIDTIKKKQKQIEEQIAKIQKQNMENPEKSKEGTNVPTEKKKSTKKMKQGGA